MAFFLPSMFPIGGGSPDLVPEKPTIPQHPKKKKLQLPPAKGATEPTSSKSVKPSVNKLATRMAQKLTLRDDAWAYLKGNDKRVSELLSGKDIDADFSKFGKWMQNGLKRYGPTITKLELKNVNLTQEKVDKIRGIFRNVSTIDLSVCTFEKGALLALSRFPSLEILGIYDSLPSLNDDKVKELTQIKTLQYLFLAPAHKITEEGMSLLGQLSHLKTLGIYQSSTITEDVITSWIYDLSELECLVLTRCSSLNDPAVLELLRFTKLKSLELKQCENIHDASVCELWQNHKSLSKVLIRDCKNASEIALTKIHNNSEK